MRRTDRWHYSTAGEHGDRTYVHDQAQQIHKVGMKYLAVAPDYP